MQHHGISISLFNPIEKEKDPHVWGVQALIDPNFCTFEDGELTEELRNELDRNMLDFMFEFPGIEGPIEQKTKLLMFRKSLERVLDVLAVLETKEF